MSASEFHINLVEAIRLAEVLKRELDSCHILLEVKTAQVDRGQEIINSIKQAVMKYENKNFSLP